VQDAQCQARIQELVRVSIEALSAGGKSSDH
jgi:hypothetical protein